MNETQQHHLSFRVGRQWYGIDVNRVIEVLHMVALTELPGTTPDVLGVMTLRDMVIPVVDLRLRFQLPEAQFRLETPIIAIRTTDGAIGIVVDDVDDVELITDMADYRGNESRYVEGVVNLPDKLLLLFDIEQLHTETGLGEMTSVPVT